MQIFLPHVIPRIRNLKIVKRSTLIVLTRYSRYLKKIQDEVIVLLLPIWFLEILIFGRSPLVSDLVLWLCNAKHLVMIVVFFWNCLPFRFFSSILFESWHESVNQGIKVHSWMNLHNYTFIGISAFRFFEWMAKMYSCKLKLKSVLIKKEKKRKEKVTRKKLKHIGTYLPISVCTV